MYSTTLKQWKVTVAIIVTCGIVASTFLSGLLTAQVDAATLTTVSAVLGSSKPAVATNLQVVFTTVAQLSGDGTDGDNDAFIYVRFPTAGTDPFTLSGVAPSDITVSPLPTGATVFSAVVVDGDADAVNDTFKIGLDLSNTTTPAPITAATALTVTILNNKITTPAKVAAAGTADIWPMSFATRQKADSVDADTGATSLATVESQAVSASILTTLGFTIAAVTSGASVYGITTDVTTTTSSIPFGTLVPGTPKEAAHTLTVNTNAPGGYNVYIVEDTDLTSGSDVIHQFQDGTRLDDAAAATWTSPAVKVSNVLTWGHLGYGSTQTSVFAQTNTWAGIPIRPAGSAAPATTGLLCKSTVAVTNEICTSVFKVETSALQPAGTYANNIVYVIAPNY